MDNFIWIQVYAHRFIQAISSPTGRNNLAKGAHTSPWLVSTRAPAPPDAKLTPFVNWLFPGSKYSGINGSFANSAATKLQESFCQKHIVSVILSLKTN
jgi:hypothetical protein